VSTVYDSKQRLEKVTPINRVDQMILPRSTRFVSRTFHSIVTVCSYALLALFFWVVPRLEKCTLGDVACGTTQKHDRNRLRVTGFYALLHLPRGRSGREEACFVIAGTHFARRVARFARHS
jgi:hypothetical protein